MAALALSSLYALWRGTLEFFTLGAAERSISNLSLIDRIEIREQVQQAVQAMREAQRAPNPALRIEWARSALRQLIVAVAAAKLKASSNAPLDWPELGQALRVIDGLPEMAPHQEALRVAIGTAYAPALANRHFSQLSDLFAFLEARTETRTPRAFRLARIQRVVGVVAALSCCGWVAITPKNLARGKSVSASSTCSDMPPTLVGELKLSRVVDGIRYESHWAACTEKQMSPWFTVDLGAPHSIRSVVVCPRNDLNWGMDDVPVQIQLSQDNQHFDNEDTAFIPFSPDNPWRVETKGKVARYVRLLGVSTSPQQIFVSEIEVYGR